jgi:hypothetical protein
MTRHLHDVATYVGTQVRVGTCEASFLPAVLLESGQLSNTVTVAVTIAADRAVSAGSGPERWGDISRREEDGANEDR